MVSRRGYSLMLLLALFTCPLQCISASTSDLVSRIISLNKLIVTPEKYLGTKVQTFGYFWSAGESPDGHARGAICQTLDDIKYGVYANCIGVLADKKFLDQFTEADGKMVQVVGKFKDTDTLSFGDSVGSLVGVSRFNLLRLVHPQK